MSYIPASSRLPLAARISPLACLLLLGLSAAAAGCAPGGEDITGSAAQAATDEDAELNADNFHGVRSPDHFDQRNHQTFLTLREENCAEVVIPRAVTLTGLRPLVPAEYTIVPIGPIAGRVIFIDYSCEGVSVDRQRNSRPTTTTIVGAQIAPIEGGSTSAYYILGIATTNPIVAARYRQLGLPVYFNPNITSSDVLRPGGTASDLAMNFVGSPLDHSFTGVTVEPAAGPITESLGAPMYYNADDGTYRLTFDNESRPATTIRLTGDFTTSSLIAPILASPARPTANFTFVRASWTTTVERL